MPQLRKTNSESNNPPTKPSENQNSGRVCPKCGGLLNRYGNNWYCLGCKVEIASEDCLPWVTKKENRLDEVATTNTSEGVSGEDKKSGALVSCRNAWLSDTEFYYCRNFWQISDMAEASVGKNGSLIIKFIDGKTMGFRLAPDDDDMTRVQWNVAAYRTIVLLNSEMKTRSEQWAATINTLIAMKTHSETVHCKLCGAENKSIETKCLHCGTSLQ